MREWTARRLAWSMGLVSIGLLAGSIGFMYLDRTAILPEVSDSWGVYNVFDRLTSMGPAVLGILLASRRRDNPLGWLFLVAGLGLGITAFTRAYAVHALVADPGQLPFGLAAGWLSNAFGPVAISMLPGLFLLFPTGSLPSRGWRWVGWVWIFLVAFLPIIAAVLATLEWSNPFFDFEKILSGPTVPKMTLVALELGFIATLVVVLLSFIGLAVRFIRSKGEERLQVKWFVSAAAVVAVTMIVNLFNNTPDSSLAFNLALLLLYAAIAIAILRYRLYDIDVIIGKTVVYGGLAAFISVVYVALVVVIGAFVGATEGLALLATAIVAIAFQPARARAQSFANRLVYGQRATPYEVLSAFSERIGETEASENLLPRMARILADGTGATDAVVWLRADAELHPVASWPENYQPGVAPTLVRGELVPTDGGTTTVPVRHQGELLGALTLTKPPNETLTPTERRLVADLAGQAGLVLRNVRLIEDLRASRQRLVAAQDEERVRLERNLHDGAQQQLVALAVKQRLVESVFERDPVKARELMGEVQAQTTEALETLRELARGIYPPILADRGLKAALEAQIRRAAVPIELEADVSNRYPREIEAAVYFSCLEALQNVAKYANASRTVVRLKDAPEWLTFTVADDGVGFDTAKTSFGTGLMGIRDRLEALGGTVEVRSRPGSGTNLSGRLPVPGPVPIAEPVGQRASAVPSVG
jgi:signal transduction histidine kinase